MQYFLPPSGPGPGSVEIEEVKSGTGSNLFRVLFELYILWMFFSDREAFGGLLLFPP